MSSRRYRLLLISAIALFLNCCRAYALDIPPLRARVNDLVGFLSQEQASLLEDQLARFEQQTSHQVAVLIIPTLDGEDIAGFSIRVAENWKIGGKGNDNGVILLVARDDRKLRIEVGYGLEGVLPDAVANRIINETIVPRFRDGDFSGGIMDGVSAIEQVIRAEASPNDHKNRISPPSSDGLGGPLLMFLLLYVPGIAMRRLYPPPSRSKGAFIGAVVGITAASLAGVILSVAGLKVGTTGFVLLLVLAVSLGVIEGLLGARRASLFFGRRRQVGWSEPFYVDDDGYSISRDKDRFRGAGYTSSGSGSAGSGSSSAGGRFSGGGGGFGGGGASGGW